VHLGPCAPERPISPALVLGRLGCCPELAREKHQLPTTARFALDAVSINRVCRSSRLRSSMWARPAAAIRGLTTRWLRYSVRMARMFESSQLVRAVFTAVLSRRSGLGGSMSAFCKAGNDVAEKATADALR